MRTANPIDLNLRSKLLAKYARKPIGRLHQFDCFLEAAGDSIVRPDCDGDALFGGTTEELRNLTNGLIRIQFAVGTKHADAVRAIRKLANWLERNPDLLGPQPDPLGGDAGEALPLRNPSDEERTKCAVQAQEVISRAFKLSCQQRADRDEFTF